MEEESIFDAAIDLPIEERAAFLNEACGENVALRNRVEALLSSFDQSTGFMRGTALEVAGLGPILEGPGSEIGPYRLLEQIGEGGMGIVYAAEQTDPVVRRVALKIIRPGLDTHEVMARFAAERQALAMMDHPHIAKVLDAGSTETGRPYFVMELVDGQPITEFCDAHRYDAVQRLKLFEHVCYAIQHAHQKGIIHRDIKPTNVLVSLKDDRPSVIVIDFGVAKAIDRDRTERTVMTQFAQVLGTPLYMSPEQAEPGNPDIDTRTDIYSLGVLLYELLTGDTPFDKVRLKEAAYDEMRRIIREEEPPKPSTKISTLGDEAKPASQLRGTVPTRLSQQLRGELDWIVMKALEKERERRYESAGGFAEDVQRFLNNEPVIAGPPSAFYRMRKFERRNRVAVASAAGVLTALLLGLVAISLAWRDAKSQRDIAQSALRSEKVQRDAAERNLGFTQVAGAFLSYQLNEPQQALSKLQQVREAAGADFRPTWEWNYVHGLLNSDLMTCHVGTPQAPWVSCLQFSDDGHLLAAGSAVSEYVNARPGSAAGIVVIDTDTQKVVRDLTALQSSVHCLLFSPDNRRLFVAAERMRDDRQAEAIHAITCWQLDKDQPLWSRDHLQASALSLTESGKHLIVIANDELEVWDAANGERLWPDGPGGVELREVRDHRIVGRGRHGTSSRRFTYSLDGLTNENNVLRPNHDLEGPQGKRFIRRRRNRELDVYDASSGKKLDTLRSAKGDFFDYDISPDGKWVATGGSDNSVTLWQLLTGRPEIVLRGHANRIHTMRYTPTGDRLATGDWDGTVKVWDTTRAPEALDLHWTWPYVTEDLAFSADDTEIAVVKITSHKYGGRLYRYDTASGIMSQYAELPLSDRNESFCHVACFSSDAARLFGVDKTDGALIHVWDAVTGQERSSLSIGPGDVHIIRCDSNGGRLVAASGCYPGFPQTQPGSVVVWDVASQEIVFRYSRAKMQICSLAISPNGKRIVVAFGGENVADHPPSPNATPGARLEIWDVDSGKRSSIIPRTNLLEGNLAEVTMTIHDDNRTLVYFDWGEGVVRFIDLETADSIREFPVTDSYYGLSISPDGTRLAAINRSLVTLLDTTDGQSILTMPGKPKTRDFVQNPQLTFSHCGKWIAGSQWDSSVWVWGNVESPESPDARRRRQQSGRLRFLQLHSKVKLTDQTKRRQSPALERLKRLSEHRNP